MSLSSSLVPSRHSPCFLSSPCSRLCQGRYDQDSGAFASDVRLVFSNCMAYNTDDSQIHQDAKQLFGAQCL